MTYAKKRAFFQKPLFLGKAKLKGSLESEIYNLIAVQCFTFFQYPESTYNVFAEKRPLVRPFHMPFRPRLFRTIADHVKQLPIHSTTCSLTAAAEFFLPCVPLQSPIEHCCGRSNSVTCVPIASGHLNIDMKPKQKSINKQNTIISTNSLSFMEAFQLQHIAIARMFALQRNNVSTDPGQGIPGTGPPKRKAPSRRLPPHPGDQMRSTVCFRPRQHQVDQLFFRSASQSLGPLGLRNR